MGELVTNLAYDLLILLATAAAALLIAWLKKRLGVEGVNKVKAELEAKQELATLAVRFVEQVYKDLHGPDKYQKAAEWLAARAQEHGLKLTADEIKGLIEAALRELKDAFGNEWAKQLQ